MGLWEAVDYMLRMKRTDSLGSHSAQDERPCRADGLRAPSDAMGSAPCFRDGKMEVQ